jgi:hypothetical protein
MSSRKSTVGTVHLDMDLGLEAACIQHAQCCTLSFGGGGLPAAVVGLSFRTRLTSFQDHPRLASMYKDNNMRIEMQKARIRSELIPPA